MSKFVTVKNKSLPFGSFIEATPLGKIKIAIDRDGSKYQAKLTARGELFRGTGQTPVLALQAVLSVIIKSAIKPGRGRPTERLRVAATLLHLCE